MAPRKVKNLPTRLPAAPPPPLRRLVPPPPPPGYYAAQADAWSVMADAGLEAEVQHAQIPVKREPSRSPAPHPPPPPPPRRPARAATKKETPTTKKSPSTRKTVASRKRAEPKQSEAGPSQPKPKRAPRERKPAAPSSHVMTTRRRAQVPEVQMPAIPPLAMPNPPPLNTSRAGDKRRRAEAEEAAPVELPRKRGRQGDKPLAKFSTLASLPIPLPAAPSRFASVPDLGRASRKRSRDETADTTQPEAGPSTLAIPPFRPRRSKRIRLELPEDFDPTRNENQPNRIQGRGPSFPRIPKTEEARDNQARRQAQLDRQESVRFHDYESYEADVLRVIGLDLKPVRAKWIPHTIRDEEKEKDEETRVRMRNAREIAGDRVQYHAAYPPAGDEAWEGVDEEKILAWERSLLYRKRFDGNGVSLSQRISLLSTRPYEESSPTPPATPRDTSEYAARFEAHIPAPAIPSPPSEESSGTTPPASPPPLASSSSSVLPTAPAPLRRTATLSSLMHLFGGSSSA